MPLVIVIPWKKNLVTIKLSGLLFKFFQILVPRKQLFWKNLVSAGSKSSKVSPHTIFNKFAVFWWTLPYTKLLLLMSDPSIGIRSNKLCILSKSDQFLKKKQSLLRTIWYWRQKCSKESTQNHSWQIFTFFEEPYHRPNFHFQILILLSESIQMNSALTARVPNFSERSVFTWNDLESAAKSSK